MFLTQESHREAFPVRDKVVSHCTVPDRLEVVKHAGLVMVLEKKGAITASVASNTIRG